MSFHEKNISQDESWGASERLGPTHNGPKCGNCNSSAPQRPWPDATNCFKIFSSAGKAQLATTRLENITPRLRKREISDPRHLDVWLPPNPHEKRVSVSIAIADHSWRLHSRNIDFLCLCCWWCVVSFGCPVPRNYYAHALKAKAKATSTKGERRRRLGVSLCS